MHHAGAEHLMYMWLTAEQRAACATKLGSRQRGAAQEGVRGVSGLAALRGCGQPFSASCSILGASVLGAFVYMRIGSPAIALANQIGIYWLACKEPCTGYRD
jgi:hypothetical protein